MFFVALVIWCKTSFIFLCSKDFLRIKDGMGKRLGMYCGNETGQNLLVTGDKVEMAFRSDDSVEEKGYYLVFTLVLHGKRDHKEANFTKFIRRAPLKISKILVLRQTITRDSNFQYAKTELLILIAIKNV